MTTAELEQAQQEKIGIDRFASFDPSVSRTRIAAHVHKPGYLGAIIYCLQHGDKESAEFIRDRNERSEELREVVKGQVELVKALDRKVAA